MPASGAAGFQIVEAAAEAEVAADQPVDPARFPEQLAEIGHIQHHAARSRRRRHLEGRALAAAQGHIGRNQPIARHLEAAAERTQRAALDQELVELQRHPGTAFGGRGRTAGLALGQLVARLERLADERQLEGAAAQRDLDSCRAAPPVDRHVGAAEREPLQADLLDRGAVAEASDLPLGGEAVALAAELARRDLGSGRELQSDSEGAGNAGSLRPAKRRRLGRRRLEVELGRDLSGAVGHGLIGQHDADRAADIRLRRRKARLGHRRGGHRALQLIARPERRFRHVHLAPADLDLVAVELALSGHGQLIVGVDHPADRLGEVDVAHHDLERQGRRPPSSARMSMSETASELSNGKRNVTSIAASPARRLASYSESLGRPSLGRASIAITAGAGAGDRQVERRVSGRPNCWLVEAGQVDGGSGDLPRPTAVPPATSKCNVPFS